MAMQVDETAVHKAQSLIGNRPPSPYRAFRRLHRRALIREPPCMVIMDMG